MYRYVNIHIHTHNSYEHGVGGSHRARVFGARLARASLAVHPARVGRLVVARLRACCDVPALSM